MFPHIRSIKRSADFGSRRLQKRNELWLTDVCVSGMIYDAESRDDLICFSIDRNSNGIDLGHIFSMVCGEAILADGVKFFRHFLKCDDRFICVGNAVQGKVIAQLMLA